jgi:hypothetical protein
MKSLKLTLENLNKVDSFSSLSLSLSLSLLRQAFKKVCFILLLTQSLTAFAQLKVNNIG